ncbi:MAG: branched-chain amino acid ABC transporter permease [Chloroflexi bacterium]|nr:branched-chain amino acid ABC transporter permease [Chloroflexota bacterium]
MLKSLPIPSRLRLSNDPIQAFLYLVGGALLVFLAFIAIRNVFTGQYRPDDFLQGLVLGLAQGSIYALIALGYTLVYGVLQMINFAHSEVFMSGAYIAFFSINAFDEAGWLDQSEPGRVGLTIIALIVTLAVGMLTSMIVALLLERIAYRPLRKAPRLVPLITAIGASIGLQQIFLQLFGGAPRNYPVTYLCFGGVVQDRSCSGPIDVLQGRYTFEVFGGDVTVRPLYFVVFFVALILMTSLWFFVQRTKMGKAMRAVSEDKNTAALMGINVDRVIVMTFVLGALMAGAAAVLFALYNRQISPFTGFQPGIKAFTAAVLGGIGNIPGAMAGGILLGIVESAAPGMLGLPTQLEDVVAFSVLVLILIFRPTGIFGEVLSKKKA